MVAAWHAPSWHVPPWHDRPHIPQWLVLLRTSVSQPGALLQSAWFAAHLVTTQLPLLQPLSAFGAEQANAHVPQFARSVFRLTQLRLHRSGVEPPQLGRQRSAPPSLPQVGVPPAQAVVQEPQVAALDRFASQPSSPLAEQCAYPVWHDAAGTTHRPD